MQKREAQPLHAQLPWFGLLGDRTVLLKSGEMLAGARLRGAPFECQPPSDLDYVSHRWTQALKSLAPGWRIRWHARKRRLHTLPQRPADDHALAAAQAARNNDLLDRGLYTVETTVYWLWDPHLSPAPAQPAGSSKGQFVLEKLSLWLSPDRTRRLLSTQVDAARGRFENALESFSSLVHDVTPLEPLRGADLFRDLALCSNSRSAADRGHMAGPLGLDRQLALSDLEAHRDHLRLDGERVETYALIDPPASSRAHLFGAILDLDSELDLMAEWRREDPAQSSRRIRSARRHYHQKRYSMMAHASGDAAPPQARGALEDRAAEAETAGLGEALRELEVDGLPFGEHSMSVALRGTRASDCNAARPALLRIAAAADARFHRETYNGVNAWLSMAPGNHARLLRRNYLSAAVAADIAPLWSISEGHQRDRHLDAEHWAIFQTRRRTPYYHCAHAGDISHALVVGATGSGKSFLLNFLLLQARKYRPRVCILDLGGSYRALTELVGGAYLEIGKASSDARCHLNPFRALEPTDDNLRFLELFVRMLLDIEGKTCDAKERSEIRAQISALYELDPDARRLSSLRDLLPASLREPLSAWTADGTRGSVFDNVEDTLTLAEWQVLDLAGSASSPDLARALLFYLLHRLGTVVACPAELSRWKLLVVDEAWRFLSDERLSAYFAEGLRTWRKCNAGVVLATQSPADASSSEALRRTVVESCLTKIFLANPEADASEYAEAFGLRPAEASAVRSLVPKRQLLMHRPGEAQVLDLNVDRRSYWLYTTNPLEAARRSEAIAAHGFKRGIEALLEDAKP